MNQYFGAIEEQIKEMLRKIGIGKIEDLFDEIPAELKLGEELSLPAAMDEPSLVRHLEDIAEKNRVDKIIFAGGGIYDHYVPPVIDYLVSRGEFLTAYTPYQAEASQGSLQAIFEYQTMICQITGLEIANASLYDGATALAEAVLMALSISPKRKELIILRAVNPQYRQVLRTYLGHMGVKVTEIEWVAEKGTAHQESILRSLNEGVACLVFQQPNFFGCLEGVEELTRAAHSVGAKAIVVVDPISLGLLKRPGEYGADIVVAEGQPLGMQMYGGGETLGIFACREELLRYLPGRLVGMSVDAEGKRAFVLTLQTREQHIRRERATSNICTNQALNALRCAIYLALMGKEGFPHLAIVSAKRAFYLQQQIQGLRKFHPTFNSHIFREFTITFDGEINDLRRHLARNNLVVGPWLGDFYPELKNSFLLALTEKRTVEDISLLVKALSDYEA